MRALLLVPQLFLVLFCASPAHADERDAAIIATTEGVIVLPEPIDDPIEPVNRFLWEVNKGLMFTVIQPTSKGYRWVVPKPLRTGIRNAGHNLGYPKRVINNLLQERWRGARDETYRFFANSIFGVAGLFDVGTRWRLPVSEADFGQTFGVWGWRPQAYLMLPLAGPSNERDAVGAVLDSFANPLTYFPPYNYINLGITYNNLTDTVDDYVRLSKIDFDPYAVLKYAWTLKREAHEVDLSFEGEQDAASLDTLGSVFFTFQDAKFPHRAETRTVLVFATGERLPVSVWLQPGHAPLVYVLPGIGSHRLSGGTLALAELLYRNGFSVATVSSTFNHEFVELALSEAMPGYTPRDAADLQLVLGAFDSGLRQKYPDRIGRRALMGYSMGGFHSLYLAATESTNLLAFDRYVAIDAPVRLDYAISQLDGFFRSATDWPAAERTERIEQTFLKVAALSSKVDELRPDSVIPFSSIESKFLIGLAFRLTLRDVIFLTQMRTNQGVLATPLDKWRRDPAYHEILQLSFNDYLAKLLVPYYQSRGLDLSAPEQFRRAVDLRAHTSALRENEKVRIIENANDILLGEEGLEWLRANFPERLTVFERGGHLGNLNHPAVQQVIIDSLADLKRPPGTISKGPRR